MANADPSIPTVTVDCHIDVPWMWTKYGPFDLCKPHPDTMVDFHRMKKGGLSAAVFALYLPEALQDSVGDKRATALIKCQVYTLRAQDGCRIVESAAQVRMALTAGLVPIFLGLEGGRLIHNSLEQLGAFRQLGVRYLTLTHNRNTSWADSATDMPYHRSLTALGLSVIREAGRLDIIVDVSHASDETCEAVLHVSDRPVIASHSGCQAVLDHPRNLKDRLIKGIAKTGGVIHIPFVKKFIKSSHGVADHIDHIVCLLGDTYHVGIGSDLDGAVLADDIPSVSCWQDITMGALAKRGYTDTDITNLTGRNTLRVLELEGGRV